MNKIIQIGTMFDYVCYLNVDKEEALIKYFQEFPTDNENYKNYLTHTAKEIFFNDRFFTGGIKL